MYTRCRTGSAARLSGFVHTGTWARRAWVVVSTTLTRWSKYSATKAFFSTGSTAVEMG